MDAQDGSHAAESAASHQVAEVIVYLLQAIEVKQQNREGTAGAISALGFILQDIEEASIIGEAGERIADGEMPNLFKETSVIEKRSAQREGVAADREDLREQERRVEKTLGLARGELGGEVHPGGRVNGAVKSRFSGIKAAAIPNHGGQKNDAGQKLLGA